MAINVPKKKKKKNSWFYELEIQWNLTRIDAFLALQVVIDPCSEYYVYAYLNREDVQEALHANVTKLKYDWEPCSDVIRKWVDSSSTVLPLLDGFLNNSLRVWIFR